MEIERCHLQEIFLSRLKILLDELRKPLYEVDYLSAWFISVETSSTVTFETKNDLVRKKLMVIVQLAWLILNRLIINNKNMV